MIGRGIGDERQDHVRIDVGHQLERDRLVGIDAERARPQAGQNQTRRDRRAKRPEGDAAAPCSAPRPAGTAAFRCRLSPPPAGRPEIRPDPGQRPLVHGFRTGWNPSRPHCYLALILASLPDAPAETRTPDGRSHSPKPLIHVAFSGNKVLWQVKVPSSRFSQSSRAAADLARWASAELEPGQRQSGYGFLDPRSASVSGADLPAAGPLGGAVRAIAARPGRRPGGGRADRPVAGRPGCDRNRPFPLHQWAGGACPSAPAAGPGRCGGDRGRNGAGRRSPAHGAARHRPAAGAGRHRCPRTAVRPAQSCWPTMACAAWW